MCRTKGVILAVYNCGIICSYKVLFGSESLTQVARFYLDIMDRSPKYLINDDACHLKPFMDAHCKVNESSTVIWWKNFIKILSIDCTLIITLLKFVKIFIATNIQNWAKLILWRVKKQTFGLEIININTCYKRYLFYLYIIFDDFNDFNE